MAQPCRLHELPPEVQSHMSQRVICPLCYGPMMPVEGLAGVWQCSQRHELLTNDNDAEQAPTDGAEARRPNIEAPVPADNPLILRAQGMMQSIPYYQVLQKQLGVMGPLPPVPQGNEITGDRCLPLGAIKMGGGSKSGRRKKNPKGGKKFTDSPWEV